jgi:RNA polymerase sigma factor (sigma-70 family)
MQLRPYPWWRPVPEEDDIVMEESMRREWIESIVEEHQSRLIRYARFFTKDLDKARDVVQETFVSLCREDGERIADHLVPWLFRVCRHRALDMLRREGRMVSIDVALDRSPGIEPMTPDPHLALEKRKAVAQVLEALALLTPAQQEVLRLRFSEGLSYKEISAITRRSVSHVGVLIHEGVKRLRLSLNAADSAGRKGGERS